MKVFKEKFDVLDSERQELAIAEKLFDLPITMYSDLQIIVKKMKGLESIYAIYNQQKV